MNKRKYTAIVLSIIVVFLVGILGAKGIKQNNNEIKEAKPEDKVVTETRVEKISTKEESSIEDKEENIVEEDTEKFDAVFSYNNIDNNIRKRISGVSYKENDYVKVEDLSHLKVTYYGFDGKSHIGELIVHKKVASEVVEIFKEIYNAKFPIEKMNLIEEYKGDDNLSMADNNTSAFNYRNVPGTKKLSKHSLGLAIDINPVQNPYLDYKKKLYPSSSRSYLDRSNVREGMIIKNDVVYKAFTKRGWTWGGNWNSEKDYQHFQKNISIEPKKEIAKTTETSKEIKNEVNKETKENVVVDIEKNEPVIKEPEIAKTKTAKVAEQIIAVKHTGGSYAKIEVYEKINGIWKTVFTTNGRTGRNGVTYSKKEGDGKSPAGVFTMSKGFGVAGNPGTKYLPYTTLEPNDYWVDDPTSQYYNMWMKGPADGRWNSAEELYSYKSSYKYSIVIDYNTARTPYKGSAIFLHVNTGPTAGCIAVDEASLVKIMKWVNPGKVRIIIAPEKDIMNF